MNIPFFRGEPEIYKNPCLPGIWRNKDLSIFPPNGWTAIEQEEVNNFRSKALSGALNDPYFEKSSPPKDNSIEWLELAQHYGYETRLLDVTLDPLAALFFAVSQSPSKNGCVYMYNEGSFNTLDLGEYEEDLDKFFEIYDLRGYKPSDETLFFYRPLSKNKRMVAQRGQFVWCRGIGVPLHSTSVRIEVSSDDKLEIKAVLARIGYSDFSLLPPGL